MELVLKEKYGEAAYKASKQPDWVQLAKKKQRIKVPCQGVNECGFYMLRYAYHFDGHQMIYDKPENRMKYKKIVDEDVSKLGCNVIFNLNNNKSELMFL